ncbi:hypothetical protein ACFLS8_03435 [Chloroflexota bacterium]
MRTFIRSVIFVVGIAVLVFGVIFIVQSGSAKQQVADSIAPLPLSQVNSTYDSVTEQQKAIMAAEEPNIKAGTAAPSAMYNYLTIQRTSLGLAKSNIGLANIILTMGIVDIVLGIGMVLTAGLIPSRKQ